jgi:hypothetical protein
MEHADSVDPSKMQNRGIHKTIPSLGKKTPPKPPKKGSI